MNCHYTTHQLSCDILVAGGGPAGVSAAIAAARAGAKVILCQDRPMLGGNASSEVRMHIVGANYGRQTDDWQIEARESGIIEEIRLENSVRNPQRSASIFDLILFDKCKAEPNLQLFLNTRVTSADVDGETIRRVHAERGSTEDQFIIEAGLFVDCTGDGGLGVAANARFIHGREGREAYGESLAASGADGKTLGSTLLFMAKEHAEPVPFVAPSWARKFAAEDFKHRATFLGDKQNHFEYGYWWLEWGGHLDTVKDNELIRDELLAIVMGVWDYIKNEGDHGADRWALDWFGVLPGKRESRRFIGQHVLSQHDLVSATPFPDGIAYGGWPIDIHPVEGIDDREAKPAVQTPLPYLYEIPLRSCVSANIANLMFAGRNISATHVAFASTRVMATCAAIGEGVGVAAAHAIRKGIVPRDLAGNAEAMREIRQALVRADAYIIGEVGDGECDHAYRAEITASSEQAEGTARNVISGQNRSVQGTGGVRPERFVPGSNRWMSDPAAGLPAWIELRWQDAIEIRKVEITFDTGLQRHLTLTHSDNYLKRMHWGAAQPETVKDFTLEVEIADGWETVGRVHDNWKRRYTTEFSSLPLAKALRIRVLSTWGLDHARIVQVAVL